MYKLMCMMRRKPGLSREEFIEHYERVHVPLAVQLLPNQRRYVRRYPMPVNNPYSGEPDPLECDVITEMWYDDPEAHRAAMEGLTGSADVERLVADEEQLFDRSYFRLFAFEEHESEM